MSGMQIPPPFIEVPYQRVGVEPEVPEAPVPIPGLDDEPEPVTTVVVERRAPRRRPTPAPKPKPVKEEPPTLSTADLGYMTGAVRTYLQSLTTSERQRVLDELRQKP